MHWNCKRNMSLAFFAVIFYLMMLLFDAASCLLFCMQKNMCNNPMSNCALCEWIEQTNRAQWQSRAALGVASLLVRNFFFFVRFFFYRREKIQCFLFHLMLNEFSEVLGPKQLCRGARPLSFEISTFLKEWTKKRSTFPWEWPFSEICAK